MAELNYKSTEELKVDKKLIEQVIGQEKAVEITKKASEQRRHVLLIGSPGTGKSMLGMGLAELLPKEKLVDIVSFANPNDENTPLIRTVPAGTGRDLIAKARVQNMQMFKNQNIFMFILVILSMIVPWWIRSKYNSDVMFAAFFLGGMIFLGAFVIFINIGKKMPEKSRVPKLIVDNYKKKQGPFFDATGAHAGALLGDVLHDPFQCFSPMTKFSYLENNLYKNTEFHKKIDSLFNKYKDSVIYKDGYGAIFLGKDELFVLAESNGTIAPVEVLSCNRQDYDGKMIKLTTSKNKELIVTPEHKIAVNRNGKIDYVSAKDIEEGDEIVAKGYENGKYTKKI
ncbi:MAG: ATP-binding protein [Nanoarchaeota archaeon]